MTATPRLLIAGHGDMLTAACAIAETVGEFAHIELPTNDRFTFDLSPLDAFSTADYCCVVALDGHAINLARLGVVAAIRLRGFQLGNLISPSASVARSVRMAGSAIVAPGAMVAEHVELGYGVTIGAGTLVCAGTKLERGVTIMEAARIGRDCRVEQGSTIGRGVVLSDATQVGRHCELLRAETHGEVIPERTYRDDLFPQGMRIFRF